MNAQPLPYDPTNLHLLEATTRYGQLLEELLRRYELAPQQVAASNNLRRIRKMQDWPVAGACRYIAPRPGFGSTVVLGAGVAAAILPPNEGRLGLTIVNIGAAVATLFLTDPASQTQVGLQIAQIGLPADARGIWPGKVGDVPWCGDVVALSAAGTTLTIAEI